jgi:dihydroxy-acid dehydratase
LLRRGKSANICSLALSQISFLRLITLEERMPLDPKHRSHIITDGRDRAGARSMLKAIGFTDADLAKPIVGIANTWIETMPCNFHLRELAAKVKEGVRAAGGTPMEFNTIAISDGVTMGTEGMKASLVSREVIADSIELLGRGHMFDAMVALVGCDKTIPGGAMALIRLNVPGIVLYGGSIAPGRFQGRDVTVGDVYEAVGAHAAGKMTDSELKDIEDHACPGAGACGGQFTANTMSTVMEFIGLSPMGANSVPALDPRKDQVAYRTGQMVMDLPASRPRAVQQTLCSICWPWLARPESRSRSMTLTLSVRARPSLPI